MEPIRCHRAPRPEPSPWVAEWWDAAEHAARVAAHAARVAAGLDRERARLKARADAQAAALAARAERVAARAAAGLPAKGWVRTPPTPEALAAGKALARQRYWERRRAAQAERNAVKAAEVAALPEGSPERLALELHRAKYARRLARNAEVRAAALAAAQVAADSSD